MATVMAIQIGRFLFDVLSGFLQPLFEWRARKWRQWRGTITPEIVKVEAIPGTCNVKVSFQFEELFIKCSARVQLQRCDDDSLTSWQDVQVIEMKGKIKEWYLVDVSEKNNPRCHYRVLASRKNKVGFSDVKPSPDLLPQKPIIELVDYQRGDPSLTASIKVKYQGDVYIALQRSECLGDGAQWEDVAQHSPQFAVCDGQEETVLIDSEVKNHRGYYYRLRVSRSQKWEFAAYTTPKWWPLPPPCASITGVLPEEGTKKVVVSYNLPYATEGFIKLERLNNTETGAWATVFSLNTKQSLLGATDLKLVDSTEKESQKEYHYRIATAYDGNWTDAVYSLPELSPPIPSIEE